MKKSLLAALLATVLYSTQAAAGTVTIDVGGVGSWDELSDPDNVVITLGFAPGAVVTAIGWDVEITPSGDSWYSEPTARFSDSIGGGAIDLTPGILDADSGDGIPVAYSSGGLVDLTSMGLADIVLADGLLRIEFFETFDDNPDALDAMWSGTLTVRVIPLPAAVWLFGCAVVALAGWRRR